MTKTLGRGPTRSERMLIILAVVALFASLVTIYMPTPAQADSHTPNQAGYWEDLYPEASECIKYGATGSNQHGSSDGTAVTLNSGFEFVVLIVKGGSVDHGYGPGNAVYENPVAGTAYSAPANAGGQSAEVSHWIICVGEEEPDEASVDVGGECVEEDFVITISAHNATVDIDLDGDGVLESGEMGLGSGDYEFTGDDENWIPWEATASEGAEFDDGKTTTSGEIYIEECEEDLIASVDIGGVCVDEMFYVTVSSENATVSVDLDGDGVFGAGETDLADGNHKVTADPGDEIDWLAVADEDAEFDEDIDELEGEIEVEDCEEEPDEASVDVGGECVEEDFVITISAHNATVDIDLDGDGVLESGEMGLGSGDYEFTGDDENWIPWEATASEGAEFDDGKTTTSGEIYIEECEEDLIASVDIGGVCVDEMFYVTVSSENATVSVDLDGDGVFGAGETDLADGNHKVTADPGDEIDWLAVADEDAEFDEDIDELEGEIEVEDCEEPEVKASIVVTVNGTCVLNEGVGQGVITVTIPVDGGATVVITDESDNVIATLTESGTVNVPEGASYSWEAEANEGFEFPPDFENSGEIDIVECSEPDVQASVLVTVTGACFVVGDDGQGRITVDMSVDGAATVVITDDDDKVIATVTKPSTITVDEGATYSWEAEANEGFEFPVGFNAEGAVVIATCSQPEELPFTGVDSEPLVAIATTLMGLGAVLVISTRRREEF